MDLVQWYVGVVSVENAQRVEEKIKYDLWDINGPYQKRSDLQVRETQVIAEPELSKYISGSEVEYKK